MKNWELPQTKADFCPPSVTEGGYPELHTHTQNLDWDTLYLHEGSARQPGNHGTFICFLINFLSSKTTDPSPPAL